MALPTRLVFGKKCGETSAITDSQELNVTSKNYVTSETVALIEVKSLALEETPVASIAVPARPALPNRIAIVGNYLPRRSNDEQDEFPPPAQVRRRLVEWTLGHVFLLWRESARHPGFFPGACTQNS